MGDDPLSDDIRPAEQRQRCGSQTSSDLLGDTETVFTDADTIPTSNINRKTQLFQPQQPTRILVSMIRVEEEEDDGVALYPINGAGMFATFFGYFRQTAVFPFLDWVDRITTNGATNFINMATSILNIILNLTGRIRLYFGGPPAVDRETPMEQLIQRQTSDHELSDLTATDDVDRALQARVAELLLPTNTAAAAAAAVSPLLAPATSSSAGVEQSTGTSVVAHRQRSAAAENLKGMTISGGSFVEDRPGQNLPAPGSSTRSTGTGAIGNVGLPLSVGGRTESEPILSGNTDAVVSK